MWTLDVFQTGQPTSLGVSASWVRYFAGTYDVPKGADASVLAALSEALHQYQLALYAFRLQELASAESGHVGCVLTCDDASCRVLCTRAMFRDSPMTPACDTIFSLHPPPHAVSILPSSSACRRCREPPKPPPAPQLLVNASFLSVQWYKNVSSNSWVFYNTMNTSVCSGGCNTVASGRGKLHPVRGRCGGIVFFLSPQPGPPLSHVPRVCSSQPKYPWLMNYLRANDVSGGYGGYPFAQGRGLMFGPVTSAAQVDVRVNILNPSAPNSGFVQPAVASLV